MIPRRPGQFLSKRLSRKLIVLVSLLGIGTLLAVLGFASWPLSLVGMVLLIVMDRLFVGRLDFDNDLKGKRGEEAVAAILDWLPSGFQALHDVEMRWGNIDHVVVGPTGIFAIETKNWGGSFYAQRGRLMHSGRAQDQLLREATRGAMDVKRRLAHIGIDLWVGALTVSTRAPVKGAPLRFRGVTVTELPMLPSIIVTGRTTLTPAQISRAVAAILRDGQPTSARR